MYVVIIELLLTVQPKIKTNIQVYSLESCLVTMYSQIKAWFCMYGQKELALPLCDFVQRNHGGLCTCGPKEPSPSPM